jgi:hypothetical protein
MTSNRASWSCDRACILEISYSNLGRIACYNDWGLSWTSSASQANVVSIYSYTKYTLRLIPSILTIQFLDVAAELHVRGSEGKSSGSWNSRCCDVHSLTSCSWTNSHALLIPYLCYWTRSYLLRIVFTAATSKKPNCTFWTQAQTLTATLTCTVALISLMVCEHVLWYILFRDECRTKAAREWKREHLNIYKVRRTAQWSSLWAGAILQTPLPRGTTRKARASGSTVDTDSLYSTST